MQIDSTGRAALLLWHLLPLNDGFYLTIGPAAMKTGYEWQGTS